MSVASTYKPSPLSFGSPRSSPFRRPESPASPSTVRAANATTSPTKPQTPLQSPTRGNTASWTPRGLATSDTRQVSAPGSPTRDLASTSRASAGQGTTLSQLSAPQVRELREAFQLLDRNSDGVVERDDVVYMLNNLGQDATPANVAAFFPAGSASTLSLPQYLTHLSALLAPLSPPEELLSAFAAFDEDDGGKIDRAELQEALLHTAPDLPDGGRPLSEREIDKALSSFTARKMFGRQGGGRGDTFNYHDFLAAVSGKGATEDEGAQESKSR
ncbi:MAG: hypothetical protein M1838_002203 [Thelocarpon superellum]|nr:MAG: hypothetical protein M1838_002203 [Thelocarpon superellum]